MPKNSGQKDKHIDNRDFSVPKITYASAFFAEIWERLWPLLVWTFICLCLYTIVSWAGLWRQIDDLYRIGLLSIFIVAALFSLYPLRNFKRPSRIEVLRRIENSSNLKDRPLSAQNDTLAQKFNLDEETQTDTFTHALWGEHKKRMASRLENLSSGAPKANANIMDKFALRAMFPLLAFIAWGFSFSSMGGSLLDGFSRHIDKAQILSRLDVWAVSPAYTGRPQLYISNKKNSQETQNFKLLTGSIFNLRYLGNEAVSAQYTIADEIIQIPTINKTDGNENTQFKKFEVSHPLTKSGHFQFLVDGTTIASWQITVEQDQPPTISFVENPKAALSGSLQLTYLVEDDFGVISAIGIVKSLEKQDPNARPLIDAPIFEISLPRRRTKSGTAKTNRDLTNHPLAGSLVELTLEARDDLKQKGFTAPVHLILPGRNFKNGLALALIEQRKLLALDANQADYVADLLDAVTQFPEEFKIDPKPYLVMRTTYRMIKNAYTDDQLRSAMSLLWETALQLEYGELSEAERKLREAQEKLSEALKNDASDAEIKKLMGELRSAMRNFLKEIQRQMAENPQNKNPLNNLNSSTTLSQKDLERMMDRIEDLARSGSKDAARELLSEMQRMIDNLNSGQQQQNPKANNELNQALDKLSDMMQKQQALMDESFAMKNKLQELRNNKSATKQDDPNSNKLKQDEFSQEMNELKERQEALKKQLGELGDEMEKLGLDPSKGFSVAESEMGIAGDELKGLNPGEAASAQGKAIQALREGANQILQQMAEGDGQGEAGQAGSGKSAGGQGRDPLGRLQSKDGSGKIDAGTKIPSVIDAQRAREIMDTIRKRLSQPLRPSLEKKYLERLLETQ